MSDNNEKFFDDVQAIRIEGGYSFESVTALVERFVADGFSVHATQNGTMWLIEAEKPREQT